MRVRLLFFGPHKQIRMPFKDKWGNDLFLDTQYIFPFGGLGEKWGQSAISLGDFMPSNPLFQVGAAVLTNKDTFTGWGRFTTRSRIATPALLRNILIMP
jgi:hypothetical protein